LTFDLDLTGTTQYGSQFGVNSVSQDGYASGRLAGLSVGEDGTIQGRYTNSQSKTLGQVALAYFANTQGLQPVGNNLWVDSAEAGQAVIGAPGSGVLGVVQSGAVEESNVDLTAELVNLIVAQRMYQANAQTVRAQDQILQTLVNLR
jgi:flagellar hook protein FlgE